MISIEEQSKLNNHSLTHIDNDFFLFIHYFGKMIYIFSRVI